MSQKAVIGIDLGGTNCRGALVTSEGVLSSVFRMPTRMEEGLEQFLDRLLAFCRELCVAAEKQGLKAEALGMGVPGIIAPEGIVRVSPNLPPLNNAPLAALLHERLGLPITLGNDANIIALGEALFGAGRNFRSFITLTLGTGVGGGLVLDRRLWEGADGAAGEVGHMTVEPEGRLCVCGSRGCLEQYASATGIVRSVQEFLNAGEMSSLRGLSREELTSHQVAEAALRGDRVALAALDEAGRRLGQVLAGIANLLNLEGAVISGGASESLDLFRPALEGELSRRAFEIPALRMKVVSGELGDDAGILGAAALTLGIGPVAAQSG
jgi:glucokinase